MNRVLLSELRTHTQPMHVQLDSHPVLKQLLEPNLTTDDYANALSALYPPQKTLEHIVITHLVSCFPTYSYVCRYPLIQQDLYQLNWQSFSETLPFICIDSPSKLLGVLYVLEGARLGSKQILLHLSDKKLPTRFFQAGVDPTGSGWKGLMQLMLMSDLSSEEVIEAAKAGFNCYIKALAQH